MRVLSTIAAIWVVAASCAEAQAPARPVDPYEDKLLTSDSAVLCMSPYSLPDAVKAVGDDKWMGELQCVLAKEGLPVVRLSPASMLEGGEPWRVRLTLPSGEGVTMWGHAFSFKLRDGRPLPAEYR